MKTGESERYFEPKIGSKILKALRYILKKNVPGKIKIK